MLLESEDSGSDTDNYFSDSSDDSGAEDPIGCASGDIQTEWVDFGAARQRFVFTGNAGLHVHFNDNCEPIHLFEHFITDELADLIARGTNQYAKQMIEHKGIVGLLKPRSRDHEWVETNAGEIKLLIGLLILQGIVQKQTTSMFFSKKNCIDTPFFRNVMTDHRFHLLLSFT